MTALVRARDRAARREDSGAPLPAPPRGARQGSPARTRCARRRLPAGNAILSYVRRSRLRAQTSGARPRVTAPAPPKALEWNLAELLTQEPLPPSCVPWPVTGDLSENLRNLQHAARTIANPALAPNDLPIDQVRSVRTTLEEALTIVATAPGILDELRRLEQAAKEIAIRGLPLDSDLQLDTVVRCMNQILLRTEVSFGGLN